MDIISCKCLRIERYRQNLAVAMKQLELIAKLPEPNCFQSRISASEISDLEIDLYNLCILVGRVSENVDLIYRYVSLAHQLPCEILETDSPEI